MAKKPAKLRLAVICGGQSPEHDISLLSGKTVVHNLNREFYQVKLYVILRDGSWAIPKSFLPARASHATIEDLFAAVKDKAAVRKHDDFDVLTLPQAIERLGRDRIECAMPILHGRFGEDGTIQGLFDMMNMPYTGSGVLASALGMDKIRCQRILHSAGVPIPQSIGLHLTSLSHVKWPSLVKAINDEFGFPCIVKPSRAGSSVGMGIAESPADLKKRVTAAYKIDRDLLIEQYIKGTEVSCGVLDIANSKKDLRHIALAPTEIVPKTSPFFDYKAKYTEGKSDEITPARLTEKAMKKVQQTALWVHSIVGCEGMSRVDMIVRRGVPYVLEVNTIPGLTPLSLLPQGAAAVGIEYPALLDYLIFHALHRE